MHGRFAVALAFVVAASCLPADPLFAAQPGQEKRDPVTAEQLQAAIDTLGAFEFPRRMDAARTVRRAPAATAVPALLRAVASHTDGYVRFRALVILSGFNDPRTRDVMVKALGDKNDRLRAVGYAWFERNP